MLTRENLRKHLSERENLAVIDVHTHSGAGHYNFLFRKYPTTQSIKDLVGKLNQSGVDFAVNFTAPSSYYYFDLLELARHGQLVARPAEDYPYQVANRQLFYETELFGNDQIIPFPVIFPGVEDDKQINALYELAKDDKLFGIKLHTLATNTSASALADSEYLQVAEDFSVPFLIHSGPDELSRPEHILRLAKQYPNIRFCIAHVGRFEKKVFDDAVQLGSENIFFDTSPFISLCKMIQRDIERELGLPKLDLDYDNHKKVLIELCRMFPHGILWGTDEPWTTISDDSKKGFVVKVDYQDEKALFDSLPESYRESIGYTNIMKFLFGNHVRKK